MNSYTASYLMSDELLAQSLNEAKKRYTELLQEVEKRKQWTPEFKLSVSLHNSLCHHKDCDFNYQFGPNGATSNVHEPHQYLAMATDLMSKFKNHEIEEIRQILARSK